MSLDLDRLAPSSAIEFMIADMINMISITHAALEYGQDNTNDPKEMAMVVEDALGATNRLAKYIKEIHALALGEKLKFSNFNIYYVFSWVSVAKDFSGITFEVSAPDGTDVYSSDLALLCIVSNLVKNVVQHAPGSHVILNYQNNIITIKDDGPGLPQSECQAINDKAPRVEYKSKGLGLNIVKHLCKRIGANISCRSCKNTGTEFSIDLGNHSTNAPSIDSPLP